MSTDPAAPSRRRPARPWTLLALSDGVVAIAITLLVLQLSVPLPAKLHDPTWPPSSPLNWAKALTSWSAT